MTGSMVDPGGGRLPSLDGLRALSISLVVLCHLVQSPGSFVPEGTVRNLMISLGPLGVRVFFVISGFLITHLLLRELENTAKINLPRFYLRRTLRIFVPYYALILVVVLLQALNRVELSPGDIPHALSYTMNYYPQRSWVLGHAWSLAVEEQFYLLWPAALVLLGRHRGLFAAAALLLVSPLLRLFYYHAAPGLIEEEVGYRFETVVDAIAAGALLAGTWSALPRQAWYRTLIDSKAFGLVPLIVLLAALIDQRLLGSLVIGVTAQNLGIAACIAWALTKSASPVGRVLNWKPVVFVGGMSYSIYLWQQLFLNPYSHSVISRFPLNLILVALAALGSYYLIEQPSLRARRRFESRAGNRPRLGETAA